MTVVIILQAILLAIVISACCSTCCNLLFLLLNSTSSRVQTGATKKMIGKLASKKFHEGEIEKDDAT